MPRHGSRGEPVIDENRQGHAGTIPIGDQIFVEGCQRIGGGSKHLVLTGKQHAQPAGGIRFVAHRFERALVEGDRTGRAGAFFAQFAATYAKQVDLVVTDIEPSRPLPANCLHGHRRPHESEEGRQPVFDRAEPGKQEGIEGDPVHQKQAVQAGLNHRSVLELVEGLADLFRLHDRTKALMQDVAQDRAGSDRRARCRPCHRPPQMAGVIGNRRVPVLLDVTHDFRAEQRQHSQNFDWRRRGWVKNGGHWSRLAACGANAKGGQTCWMRPAQLVNSIKWCETQLTVSYGVLH